MGDPRLGRKPKHARPPENTARARQGSKPVEPAQPEPPKPETNAGSLLSSRSRLLIALVVTALLALQYTLSARSLLQENPTVDEVVHMPAGITYWQQGTFKLYHHNPPLFKLWASLPVVWAGPRMQELYQLGSWRNEPPSMATFSQSFAWFNADRYFELFQLARLMMPVFAVLGGLVVFTWSSRMYGAWGGLLSLVLWVFCPNIMAHGRLITSDVSATAFGAGATYLFWRYLKGPSWRMAAVAGVALGLAELCKFSMLLLYFVWPFLWTVRLVLVSPRPEWPQAVRQSAVQALLVVSLSILVIDLGYGFEGVGKPLGDYEFASRSLTRPVTGAQVRPRSRNQLYDVLWPFRINRFRGTVLGKIPAPLPEHYLLGFDEQKIETEGIPFRFGKAMQEGRIVEERAVPESSNDERGAYPVYLNGELRNTGWWYYYFLTLVYKIPEGTWLLVLASVLVLIARKRSPDAWADEIALATVPVVILVTMSFLTDINLGLRYVLPILPYAFISAGKLAPWAAGLKGLATGLARASIVAALGLTIAASLWIYPHYLAYFNWTSGGPDRVPSRLIDSNLDWGQDLLGLKNWCQQNIPGQPIGLAYFGQINPTIFTIRGEKFPWFLPPAYPGTSTKLEPTADPPAGTRAPALPLPALDGPAPKLTPGYYAVSASLLAGLPWRLYDPAPPLKAPGAWAPAWNARAEDAFGYFRLFTPSSIVARIGHSIYVYRLTEEDVKRAEGVWAAAGTGR